MRIGFGEGDSGVVWFRLRKVQTLRQGLVLLIEGLRLPLLLFYYSEALPNDSVATALVHVGLGLLAALLLLRLALYRYIGLLDLATLPFLVFAEELLLLVANVLHFVDPKLLRLLVLCEIGLVSLQVP